MVLFGNGTVSNSVFTSIGRTGVLAYGTSCTSATVSSNTYKGKGPGDQIDYAVEVDAGAQVAVSYNNIVDCSGICVVDGTRSAGIHVVRTPAGSSVGTLRNNTITRCAIGVDVSRDISDTSTAPAAYNNISGNALGVRYQGRDQSRVNFRSNWWGSSGGPGLGGAGGGDGFEGPINWLPYLLMPYNDNSLYLEASWNGGIYIKPGQTTTVWMRMAHLREMVKGCQAMLGYSSTYLDVGNVAPGGGDWDEMIYQSWAVPGEIDTAIGVKGSSTTGTQADGTVGVLTLTAKNVEGTTQLVFRPDADPDPGLVKSTFFSGNERQRGVARKGGQREHLYRWHPSRNSDNKRYAGVL